jgi:hypothetical protein
MDENQLELGEYVADVLQSKLGGEFWYCVIQLRSSREIISMERFDTREEASRAARSRLESLARAAAAGE